METIETRCWGWRVCSETLKSEHYFLFISKLAQDNKVHQMSSFTTIKHLYSGALGPQAPPT